MDSPFTGLCVEVLTNINASRGFQILRTYLSNDKGASFCENHDRLSEYARQTFLLHRDILHAMIVPVVQLFQRASTLAAPALCTEKAEDLELAFRGEARDAFVWLQAFLAEEEEWCSTIGCPACVTTRTISTESTIRLTATAALLSSYEHGSSGERGSCADDSVCFKSPSLPNFTCVLPALRRCLEADPFWGPDFYNHLHSRAERTCAGIRDLIGQCSALEVLVASLPSSPVGQVAQTRQTRAIYLEAQDALSMTSAQEAAFTSTETANTSQYHDAPLEKEEMKLQKGRWARRQSRLKQEEREVLFRMAWDAWQSRNAIFRAQRQQQPWTLGVSTRGFRPQIKRRRSLTCP